METLLKSQTQTVSIAPENPLVIIGERINPTGRKKLSQALKDGQLELVQGEALKQVSEGAHVLDVNVGVSGIDEVSMIREVIQAISEKAQVPLCIDSANPKALQAGLETYQGKALVNSVNGEERKLKEILPLVSSFKAAVVGLTMDDEGIPTSADKRLKIAEKIADAAQKQGISLEDVVIDPLAMSISTDQEAALTSLRTMRLIRDKLGLNQTLGVSNISFGVPDRAAINSIFLALACFNGLTSAIIDPTIWEIRRAALITDLLQNKDEFCMNYITVYREKHPD